MKLADVIDNLSKLLASVDKKSFVYDFLAAFGTPKATLARLKSGNLNVAKKPGCILLKGKVYFEPVIKELIKIPSPRDIVEMAIANPQIERNKARFLLSTDFKEFVAFDTKRKEWLEVAFKELGNHYTFFLPLAGMEKTSFQEETDADVRAAEQMAKLYDLIIADNPPSSKMERHQLNVFLTRLLFCLFAEDTGIFPSQLFTNSMNSFSQSDGSDVSQLIQDIFLVLSTELTSRKKIKPHLTEFPYVNGGLFNDTASKRLVVPKFSGKSRLKLIDLGGKSWKEINPDIFGSMFQGVVDAEVRADLGMHYTSVPNIMKVIKPLFLDDLHEDFEKAKGSESKLNSLLKRIYSMQIFDPACGSGNFLIIAYKELRRLEMSIFKELQALTTQLPLSGIHVSQFYGIEIDDFAHEVAILAMWLAEHQMNVDFKIVFGKASAALPLREGAKIVCGNSTRLNWNQICPNQLGGEIFVIGNPPYLGARQQNSDQKADVNHVCSKIKGRGNLDYVACFLLLGAEYIRKTKCKVAFVSTNSIGQGEQVALLWPNILSSGVEIGFVHTSFKWSNSAKANAAVICVIIGLRQASQKPKLIYNKEIRQSVSEISPYLVEGKAVYITKRQQPISDVPNIEYGSFALDDGNYTLTKEDRGKLLSNPNIKKEWIRLFIGAKEFIYGNERYCLFLDEKSASKALKEPEIKRRVDAVACWRANAGNTAKKHVDTPHLFAYRQQSEDIYFVFPTVSSERRDYIPAGMLHSDVIASNQLYVISNARKHVWIFSVISSRMHMVWIKAVAGRLKTDIRYSSSVCYNNFPFPKITDHKKQKLSKAAEQILAARENHPTKNISFLYDPDKMPSGLKSAHIELDLLIEQCYRTKPFKDDEERLAYLFALYRQMTGGKVELEQVSLLDIQNQQYA